MLNTEVLDDLRTRLLSGDPLFFLQTFEERRWTSLIESCARELGRQFRVWRITDEPDRSSTHSDAESFLEFLNSIDSAPEDMIFLILDAHPYLDAPRVLRKLRDLAAQMPKRGQALLFMGPSSQIPVDVSKIVVLITLPLPALSELQQELAAVLQEYQASGSRLDPSAYDQERLCKTVLGLTGDEARRAFRFALLNADQLTDEIYAALISEKRQMVQGSDFLEFYDLDEGAAEIGGLDALKDWLISRSEAFSSSATDQGISTPKGVFLLGVQGCGKSLTARVTASMLKFPLVRLDTSALLASSRGASEKNLREVLKLVESIAPAVLWIDEIDKAFAGFQDESTSDATMSRIVGAFLTWMEEKSSQVFVVATANSVTRLPPELLRRGRFDELFFVDLPNFQERRNIYAVHIEKRGWSPEKFDLDRLAEDAEGYSGAEIAQIVSSALLESFSAGDMLSEEYLIQQRELTVPLSKTKEDEIFELREWARSRCRPATPDSRVAQMLEEESRKGLLKGDGPSDEQLVRWKQFADHGQMNAAAIEYVRARTAVGFDAMQNDFAEFLETTGPIGIALRSDPNVVLWSGLSGEFSELLAALIKNHRLFAHPAPSSFYAEKDLPFSLPTVEVLTDEKLQRPYWFPVTIKVSPPVGDGNRLMNVARMKLSKGSAAS